MYRRTDPPPPPLPAAKPKANTKKAKAAARASKRRRTRQSEAEDVDVLPDAEIEGITQVEDSNEPEQSEDTFGGYKWECVAVSLSDYQDFISSIQKSRDPDEKALHERLSEEVLPKIEEAEERRSRKQQKQERELLNLQRMATAKRSSRLEAKFEKERQEQEEAEIEKQRRVDLSAAKRDQERQKKMEEDRQSRMMTREQRLKDREYRRILHEEELANLSEENRKVEAGESRGSERHLKAEMEKKKKDIAALQEEDEWFFDCSKCGVHGSNLVRSPILGRSTCLMSLQDDGSHSVACERCNVWQHSACLGIPQEDAEKDDFHFVCQDCKQREEDAKKPKIPSLKFHLGTSSTPPKYVNANGAPNGEKRKISDSQSGLPPIKKFKTVKTKRPADSKQNGPRPQNLDQGTSQHIFMNGPILHPHGQEPSYVPPTSFTGSGSSPPPTNLFPKTSPYASVENASTERKPTSQAKTPQTSGSDRQRQDPHSGPSPSRTAYSTSRDDPLNNGYPPSQQHPVGRYQPYQKSQRPEQNSLSMYQSTFQYQTPQYPAQNQPSYTSPPPTQAPRSPSQGSAYRARTPPNPYANTFERQPTLPQPSRDLPAPLRKAPTLSPPQQQAPTSSNRPFQTPQDTYSTHVPPNHFRASPQTNGLTGSSLHDQSVLPPTGLPAQSPLKHPSPPTSFTLPAPASSPTINQPLLQPRNVPKSPGFSPTKQSPPAPMTHPVQKTTNSPNILPPVQKLSPSLTRNEVLPSLQESLSNVGSHFPDSPSDHVAETPSVLPNLGAQINGTKAFDAAVDSASTHPTAESSHDLHKDIQHAPKVNGQ